MSTRSFPDALRAEEFALPTRKMESSSPIRAGRRHLIETIFRWLSFWLSHIFSNFLAYLREHRGRYKI